MNLLKQLYSIHSKSGMENKMRRFIIKYVKRENPNVTIVKDTTGNIYITKGDAETYPVIVAHLDQVQENHSKDFTVMEVNGVLFGYSSKNRRFEGLGADDKNGIWIALKSLEKYDTIKLAFFVGEEIGCIGSNQADMDFFKDARFVIQPDRRGNNDLITSICGLELCSKEFISAVNAEKFGYREEDGLMTDIETLKINGLEISAVDLSCAYYRPHTDTEFTVIKDLENCLAFVQHIIENCTETYPHKAIDSYYYRGYSYWDDEECYLYEEIWDFISLHPGATFEDFRDCYKSTYASTNETELRNMFEQVKYDAQFFEEEKEDDAV